jgi:hypothetical protein
MFFSKVLGIIRSYWSPRPRGIERIRRMREDLSVIKKYAENLPGEAGLDLVDKIVSKTKPLLQKINLKDPPP